MKTNLDYNYQILSENYRQSDMLQSFKDYVKIESENDTTFFAWFFRDEKYEYYSDLSNKDKTIFNDFLNSL